MNEIFSFRKKLNVKKILIITLIIFVIAGLFLWKSFSPSEESISSNTKKIESTETTFYSKNKNFSLTLSNSYNFTQFDSGLNYILELRNINDLNIFVSEENVMPNLSLSDLVNADIKSFVSQFKNSSNISNVSEFNRGDKLAYTYSLHYLDNNTKTAFYLQTIWLEYNNKYYIIDIEFPLSSLNENSKIINDVLNSIVIK